MCGLDCVVVASVHATASMFAQRGGPVLFFLSFFASLPSHSCLPRVEASAKGGVRGLRREEDRMRMRRRGGWVEKEGAVV